MISVIIPAWNEAEHLPETLERMASFKPAHEIILVDAGSVDATVSIAQEHGGQVVLSRIRQRAHQLNLGAGRATGDILLFLHADTVLPQRAFERINEAFEHPKVVGGGFRRYFLSESIFLQLTCRLTYVRNRAIGWHLGDQAMFASATAFQKLGGFREMDRFEDLDFSRRLKKLGKLTTIPNPVLTSGRRFEQKGPFRTTVRDFWWTMKYVSGNKAVTQKSSKELRSLENP
ncbi:MAG: TIGR04283 family arsenosugar biosynthesis glycosyltransferase [Verrucomicrobiales bacterium]